MKFSSKRMLALAFAVAAGCAAPSVTLSQDPVDQQVSPEVKSLQASAAKNDAVQWHNLENFIHEKIKAGVRGKALAATVRTERERLGLTGMDKEMVKKMLEYEQSQERIEKLERKDATLKAHLGAGNVNDSKLREVFEQKIKKHQAEIQALEKRSSEILTNLSSAAKY